MKSIHIQFQVPDNANHLETIENLWPILQPVVDAYFASMAKSPTASAAIYVKDLENLKEKVSLLQDVTRSQRTYDECGKLVELLETAIIVAD